MTAVQNLQPFNAIKFQTKDGENITATKENGVVTLVGDVNGTRQMPLEQFMQELPEVLPPLERTPENDEVTFQGKKDKKATVPDEYFVEYKVKAGKGKKAVSAMASTFMPGLGQAFNGDWGRGAAHWFIEAGLWALGSVSLLVGNKKLGVVGAGASLLGIVANRIVSAVNAAKNATSTIKVEKKAV